MSRLLCTGEIMVEMAPAEGGLYAMGFAGDTFNTAWYARRLLGPEHSVGYLTAVGRDAVSDSMVAFIEEAGVDAGPVQRIEGRTVGLYMIQLQEGERSFSYWRGQSAAKCLADDPAALDAGFAGASVIQFSGITLAILSDAARARFCAALQRAREGGAHIAFDTNLRPRLWAGPDAMRAGLLQGASVADTVLPSFDEEQMCFGDYAPAETIARYRKAGARTVVVKNGSERCHIWDAQEGEATYDPTPVPRVVDSTAAGDSFGAGYLAARLTGASVRDATEKGATLAGRVVQKRGALAPDLFE